ncbi:type III-A CRISPR-associated protein Cas10/Csm1 [Spirochaetia bacterium 38H-sp]|uniref:CRISPR system single-strand-specific deoxyribonuclease Cas10/Csm1 (subtype III-A) n=1 Tax=Rarispira pelagica TaxID=3141764 RepID=A0ABU9U968_9SPIR
MEQYNGLSYKEIIIAALLHDIGKIAQRAEDNTCNIKEMEAQILPKSKVGNYYTHRHALYTYGAMEKLCKEIGNNIDIRPGVVASLAARHHSPTHWAEHIIAESDRLSSGADRKENEEDKEQSSNFLKKAKEQALLSVFSSVSIFNNRKKEKVYYKLQPLTGENAYPSKESKYNQECYKKIWDGLYNSIISIKEKDFDDYLAALDSTLEYWTWAIPSSTIDQPDISLYDHSRTTAAFASVLYQWHSKNNNLDEEQIRNKDIKKFGLITGDISGIQNYLFDLKDTEKSTKILRARSFEIRAVTDSIAKYILDEFNLNRFCIISTAGGRFTLVLPNHNDAKTTLEKIKQEIDVFFIEKHLGKIALCISDIQECSYNDFMINSSNNTDFKNTFSLLQKKSYISKQQKLHRGLKKKGHIIEDYYNEINSAANVCKMCDVKPIKKEENHCVDCSTLIKIGGALPKAKYIKLKDGNIQLFRDKIEFYSDEKNNLSLSGMLSVNTYKEGRGIIRLPYTVPVDGKEALDFSEIAEKAEGVKYLAIFKADLDNLGLIFSEGLNNNLSISRYASLSRMLDFFFSVRVRELIETKEEWKNAIYCVYSGGDDLCLIGAWDKVLNFCIELQEDFKKYVGNNENLTISGGIAFIHQGLPIARMTRKAEEELEKSKDTENKNKITIIDITATWEDFSSFIKLGKDMKNWIKKELISARFIYRLLIYSRMAKNFLEGNINSKNILWKSHYTYMIKRNIKKEEEEMITELKGLAVEEKKTVLSGIAATYALYSIRETK